MSGIEVTHCWHSNCRFPFSAQFGLQPSPVHGSAEESLMNSMNGGSIQLELEGIDTEKDKMLVEKQKVINELTWKLQQEQRQVEELRMQLQKRKRSNGLEEKQQPTQHFFGVPIKQENTVSSCPFASKQTALKGQASSSDKISNCGVPQLPHIVNSHCLEPAGQSTISSSTFLSPQCSPQHSPLGAAKSPQHISLPPSPNNHYLLSVSPGSQAEGRSGSPQTKLPSHSIGSCSPISTASPVTSPSGCRHLARTSQLSRPCRQCPPPAASACSDGSSSATGSRRPSAGTPKCHGSAGAGTPSPTRCSVPRTSSPDRPAPRGHSTPTGGSASR
ncbi:myocardin-like [Podargus strigoides]